MKITRFGVAVAGIGAGAMILAGCAAPGGDDSGLQEGTAVTVGWNQPFYSYNVNTTYGNATANAVILSMTLAGFNYYDNQPALQLDESFGTYELVSEDPLTITYTITDGVQWSDGTPVDAADLLLNWAALSRALDTPDFDPSEFTDPDTGQFTDAFPTDVVYFDSGATPDAGLGLVTQTPEISEDGKSITLVYDAPFVDWELSFPAPLPAHVVGKNALGIEDNSEAKQAVIDAILGADDAALAPISSFWSSGFNFETLPEDPDLYLSTGPYVITDFVAGEYMTLTANTNYKGQFTPNIEEVTVRWNEDPLAQVQALENGELDVISPQATADILTALNAIDGISVISGTEATYEHIDLQFDQSLNGHFNDPVLRESFLKVIPRQEIIDQLIIPLNPNAELRNSQLFVPGAPGYDESVATNGSDAYLEVDVEGSAALLAEAGVTAPEACLLYGASNVRRQNEFALLQASAAEAGWVVTDCGSDQWGGLLGTPGAYDASLFGWQSTSLGVTSSGPTFQTGGINNLNFYSNAEVDELIAELNVTFDPARQIEIQQEIDALLWGDFYGVTIFQFPAVAGVSDRIVGVAPSILSPTIFWNIYDWTVAEVAETPAG